MNINDHLSYCMSSYGELSERDNLNESLGILKETEKKLAELVANKHIINKSETLKLKRAFEAFHQKITEKIAKKQSTTTAQIASDIFNQIEEHRDKINKLSVEILEDKDFPIVSQRYLSISTREKLSKTFENIPQEIDTEKMKHYFSAELPKLLYGSTDLQDEERNEYRGIIGYVLPTLLHMLPGSWAPPAQKTTLTDSLIDSRLQKISDTGDVEGEKNRALKRLNELANLFVNDFINGSSATIYYEGSFYFDMASSDKTVRHLLNSYLHHLKKSPDKVGEAVSRNKLAQYMADIRAVAPADQNVFQKSLFPHSLLKNIFKDMKKQADKAVKNRITKILNATKMRDTDIEFLAKISGARKEEIESLLCFKLFDMMLLFNQNFYACSLMKYAEQMKLIDRHPSGKGTLYKFDPPLEKLDLSMLIRMRPDLDDRNKDEMAAFNITYPSIYGRDEYFHMCLASEGSFFSIP